MTPRFLDFSGKLQPFEDVFREISDVTSRLDIPFFVVGAFVRDLILKSVYGIDTKIATEDIDLGIQVSNWDQFEQLKASLIGPERFKPDQRQQQRLEYKDLVKVDIVPFGAIEKDGAILWPDEETKMPTLGFDEAYKDTIAVRVAEDVEIRICSLAGLTLMKLIAWNDRRFRYQKDAKDLGLLMLNYLDAGNQERVLGEGAEHADLLNENFDYNLASARVLGRDVGKLLSERSIGPVLAILEEQTGDKSQYPLVNAMLSNFHNDFDTGLAILESFRQGVLDVRQ